ncbi:GNAT family N-acetyltransferase [Polluticoccus soli]|uniref:GNAT family N-acetyltransferase n=1 Tax=Polluticoccus soli TaxID=3034150 RepID=UPI0023E0CEE3|nr:GNAT family N-acetyltransferase [Flavipsychrobacter sp. JY13-12]
MTLIRFATIDDAATIRNLAEAVWWPTYTPILTEPQINYMLDTMYDLESIKTQISTDEQTYLLLIENDRPMGFAAYSPRKENPAIYKLHKLYVLPETHGSGFGRLLLAEVEKAVLNAGKTTLELNVNRYNPAKSFYEKMGFVIAYEEDIDIGRGYQMNDFVMRKVLV